MINNFCSSNIFRWEHEQARRLTHERKGKSDNYPRASKNHIDAFHLKELSRYQQHVREPADVAIAREELQNNKKFQIELEVRKKQLLEKLDEQKNELAFLEESCQKKITNEEHREVLNMLCKLHEFEITNIEFQSIKLMREYLLEQKDLKKQREVMRQNMVQEIIEMQKNIIKGIWFLYLVV